MRRGRQLPPILVTGSIRSGSTFVGKMLSASRKVGYIHEPFNKDFGLKEIDRWFLYITKGGSHEAAFRPIIERLLAGRAHFKRPPPEKASTGLLPRISRSIFVSRSNLQYVGAMLDPRVTRYLIKDPIACMSSEFLHREFGMDVVIVVRHPAAFVSSVKRMGWPISLDNFRGQPELIKDHLASVIGAYGLDRLSPIEANALHWVCIYSVLDTFSRRNPRMIVVRHEDLSRNSQVQFRELYERLGISFTRRCQDVIEIHTSDRNPRDPTDGHVHTLARNSKANIDRWKELLCEHEVQRVKEITEHLASRYYSSDEW